MSEALTSADCRQGIRTLMIEYLGFRWARANLLEPYGGLDLVPEADLPGLYSMAQLDALEVASGAVTPWWPARC